MESTMTVCSFPKSKTNFSRSLLSQQKTPSIFKIGAPLKNAQLCTSSSKTTCGRSIVRPIKASNNPQGPLTHVEKEEVTNIDQLTETVKSAFEKAVDFMTKPVIAAALIASLLLVSPDAVLAASSGGRVGGRNFSSRSYSAPSQSYSAPTYVTPGYSAPFFAPSPFFSPFGFGPTFIIGGGGGFGGVFGLLFFGMAALFIFNTVTGFLSNEGDDLYDTETTSVVRLQIGLLGIARGLQKDLDRIAQRADTSSPEGLHYVLTETTLSLLRNPNYSVYGFSSSEVKGSVEEGESTFNRLSFEERGKFSRETLVNVNDVQKNSSSVPTTDSIGSEYIVVTIVAAAEGKVNLPKINNSADLREALTILGSIPADQLQAVEILWTPQAEGDTLSTQELLLDYPSLRSL